MRGSYLGHDSLRCSCNRYPRSEELQAHTRLVMPAPAKSEPTERPSAKVDYVRQEILNRLDDWGLIRDCLSGPRVIKSKTTTYLVKPNKSDVSQENQARYDARLGRAVFYNVVGRTLKGLVGQVFSKD